MTSRPGPGRRRRCWCRCRSWGRSVPLFRLRTVVSPNSFLCAFASSAILLAMSLGVVGSPRAARVSAQVANSASNFPARSLKPRRVKNARILSTNVALRPVHTTLAVGRLAGLLDPDGGSGAGGRVSGACTGLFAATACARNSKTGFAASTP